MATTVGRLRLYIPPISPLYTPSKGGQRGYIGAWFAAISVAAVAATEAATVAQEIPRDHLRSSGPLPAVPARPPSR
eukprot:749082-Prorocentrum_minimum.AAC.1